MRSERKQNVTFFIRTGRPVTEVLWNQSHTPVNCRTLRKSRTTSSDEPDVLDGEVRQGWEDGGHVRRAHTKPRRQGSAVLVERGRWNPSSVRAGIIVTAQHDGWELAVHVAALHRAADHEVVVPPGMVRAAVGIRLEGARKIRFKECSHLRSHTQCFGCMVKGVKSRGQLCQQPILCGQLCAVGIEASERNKKDLALEPQCISCLD